MNASPMKNREIGIFESHPCGEAEKPEASFATSRLRQDVPQNQVVHEHVGVLGRQQRAGEGVLVDEPGGAGGVAGVIDEQQGTILVVFPQRLRPDDAAFLDGAIIVAG